jgi:Glyoxalase/Bleomycin resistance protein/Dioxygenase superfamily
MNVPLLAPNFCQIAWVVKDIASAEKFFTQTMGIKKFFHIDNLAAKDTEGTYLGQPGDWVINLYIANAGDTQIELIQPVSGKSMFNESLERHGDAVQHVAYWLDDSEYDAAAHHLESAGYPLIQSFKIPLAQVGYFDTRLAIGVVTEIVGATKAGHEFRQNLKDGTF